MAQDSSQGLYIFYLLVVFSSESYFRNKKIDEGWLEISAIGINLLPLGIEKNIPSNGKDLPLYETETKIGTPIARVVSREYLDNHYWDEKNIPPDPSNEPSISITYNINQLKPRDKDGNFTGINKFSTSGLENLLKLGEEKIPIFINPAHE